MLSSLRSVSYLSSSPGLIIQSASGLLSSHVKTKPHHQLRQAPHLFVKQQSQQRCSLFHNQSSILLMKVRSTETTTTTKTKAKTTTPVTKQDEKNEKSIVIKMKQKQQQQNEQQQHETTTLKNSLNDNYDKDKQDITKNNDNKNKKRIDVAIVGLPNAGKSQLLNVLTKSNIAAVSRKSHTTRDGILGVYTTTSRGNKQETDPTQIVYMDTPGYLNIQQAKKERLLRDLIVTATSQMETVDYTLVVIDAARKLTDELRQATIALMLHALTCQGRDERMILQKDKDEEDRNKFAIVLNKVDLIQPKSKLLDIAMEYASMADHCVHLHSQEQNPFVPEHNNNQQDNGDDSAMNDNNNPTTVPDESLLSPIFYVSALKQEGIDDITNHLLQIATPTNEEWVITDPNQVTDMDYTQRIEELIRQSIYRCTHREVPHAVQQKNTLFLIKEKEDSDSDNIPALVTIHQDLIVQTKSHQRLVNGGSGRKTLQRIHDSAVKSISYNMFGGCPIDLQLRVTLKKSKNKNK